MTLSFNSFLRNIAPPPTLDDSYISNEIKPGNWTYKKEYNTKSLKYNPVHETSGKKKLEKIYVVMKQQLDTYHPTQIDKLQKNSLDVLKDLINAQTITYKNKHKGFSGKIYLAWRGCWNGGHIDKLTQDLLARVDELHSLPEPILDTSKKEEMLSNAQKKRKEISDTEKVFYQNILAALEDLSDLIKLSKQANFDCEHPLLRSEGAKSLADCRKKFGDLATQSLFMHESFEQVLAHDEDFKQNESLARIYSTDIFVKYRKRMTDCAIYYTDLSALIDVICKNPNISNDQQIKLKNSVAHHYMPVVQRIMRHDLLMKEYLECIPNDDPSYNAVVVAATEANRAAVASDVRYNLIEKQAKKKPKKLFS